MNERTKQLWEESQQWNGSDDGRGGLKILESVEKFAELIVRECISIVDEQKECLHEEEKYWHDRDYGYEMAVDDASKGIKQFFGVEK